MKFINFGLKQNIGQISFGHNYIPFKNTSSSFAENRTVAASIGAYLWS